MTRRFLALTVVIAVAVAATGVGLAITSDGTSKPAPYDTATATSVASLVDTMKLANSARFVATYRLHGYLFFSNGTTVIAQIPSLPGMKAKMNRYGYSGTGRYAYIFRGLTGRIVQWIEIDTNVSVCANTPVTGNYETGTFGKLRCSSPSPYIPSNGFAEQDAGFVPTYVLQQVTDFVGVHSQKRATVTTRESREFGPLRCLTQFSTPTTQTTCVNRAGFIVSWLQQNGSHIYSRVTLTSLNHHPTAHDFTTLLRPTTSFILPAV